MSYNIQISGYLPNGGQNELNQVKIAIADMLNVLTDQGHSFETQYINGEPLNLQTAEGRQQAVQANDSYQEVLREATEEARRTSMTTATQAADIAGDDPGLPDRGRRIDGGAPGTTGDAASGSSMPGNPTPEEGVGTLQQQRQEHPTQAGTPSGQPSGASNPQGQKLSEPANKPGEVSSNQSVPGTPSVTDAGKAQAADQAKAQGTKPPAAP